MKMKLMAAASVLALMMPAAVYAANLSATAVYGSEAAPPQNRDMRDGSMTGSVKRGLVRADDGMRDTADDIRAFLVGKDQDHRLHPVLIRRSMTAHGLIGQPVVDRRGRKIADVQDIIMNRDGKAVLVVVSDGGVLGLGDKVAAFDYDKVVGQGANGRVVMMLSKDMVRHARDFSYDQHDWSRARVIPRGSLSVNRLLEGDVLDENGRKVAAIENVYFRGTEASQIIVGFHKTLGMGGDLAAIDYDDLKMVRKDKDLDFQLTSRQTAQFRRFEKSVNN